MNIIIGLSLAALALLAVLVFITRDRRSSFKLEPLPPELQKRFEESMAQLHTAQGTLIALSHLPEFEKPQPSGDKFLEWLDVQLKTYQDPIIPVLDVYVKYLELKK